MKIIKPFDIDDTSLVSSTIPEPDASKGEVEWVQKDGYVDGTSLPLSSIASFKFSGADRFFGVSVVASTIAHVLDYDLQQISQIDFAPTMASVRSFCAIDAVAYGRLFLYDSTTQRAYEWDVGGLDIGAPPTLISSYSIATNLGSFNPADSACAISRELFVIGKDHQNPNLRVQRFATGGAELETWEIGTQNTSGNEVFTDGSFIYVYVGVNKTIKKYSTTGELISTVVEAVQDATFFDSFSSGLVSGGFRLGGKYDSSNPSPIRVIDYNEDFSLANIYQPGDEVVVSTAHKKYSCAVATKDSPEVGVALTPPSWVEIGPTNKWAMFSNLTNTKSEDGNLLISEVTSPSIINGVAGFDIDGATEVNVTVTKAGIGEIYNKTIALRAPPPESGWYSYLFDEVKQDSSFVLTDLPAYSNTVVKVTLSGADVSIGALLLGGLTDIGTANYSSSLQLVDYSKKERDDFGNVNVIKRTSSKLVKFNLTIPTQQVESTFSKIQDITTIPAVYIGAEGGDNSLVVFGYYEDYHNNITAPTVTTATLTVQGLA